MATVSVLLLLLSAFSPPVFTAFHVIPGKMTQSEARDACRGNNTDLVTVYSEEDNTELVNIMRNAGISDGWIGLNRSQSRKMKWSNGDAVTFNNLTQNTWTYCATMLADGRWDPVMCTVTRYFMCYEQNASSQTPIYHLICECKTWFEAQSYCRRCYTDLVSIRDQQQNEQVKTEGLKSTTPFWIGLLCDDWQWTAGGNSTYRKWDSGDPQSPSKDCVVLSGETWSKVPCSEKHSALCYSSANATSATPMSSSTQTTACANPVSSSTQTTACAFPVSCSTQITASANPVSSSTQTTASANPVSSSTQTTASVNPVSSSTQTTASANPVSSSTQTTASVNPVSSSTQPTASVNTMSSSTQTIASANPVSSSTQPTASAKAVSNSTQPTASENPVSSSTQTTASANPVSSSTQTTASAKPVSNSTQPTASENPVSNSTQTTASANTMSSSTQNTASANTMSSSAQTQPPHEEGFLHVSDYPMPWEDMLGYCTEENRTGVLIISSADEQKVVETELNNMDIREKVWVGLRQSRLLGFWMWVDGTAVYPYSNWYGGKQPDGPLTQHCGAVVPPDYTWRDMNCQAHYRALCYTKCPS